MREASSRDSGESQDRHENGSVHPSREPTLSDPTNLAPRASEPAAREILDGIALEIAATPRKFTYLVSAVRRVGDVCVVTVDLSESPSRGIEDAMEGASAWWPGEPSGHADVLSVDAEREQINLRYAAPGLPAVGGKLVIYPPLFLEALHEWWKQPANASRAQRWLQAVKTDNHRDDDFSPLTTGRYPRLRASQRRAFALPDWNCGLLEGPPGTGKTTTLGMLLATLLSERPACRVLLLSTTNTAVDLALVAVDRALEEIGAYGVRRRCKRIGHHFQASHYRGREHLLPSADPELIARLAELESSRPEPHDAVAYSRWKQEYEILRARLRVCVAGVLAGANLAAMTACAAMCSAEALEEAGPFDLVVFDEASQVGLAYAGALATYGRRCLFAGDPAQLAPVVQSKHAPARRWLGRSAFNHVPPDRDGLRGHHCFLEEQSRMCEPICAVVGRLFYGRRLRVAADALARPEWHRQRELTHPHADLRRPVWLHPVKAATVWSAKYRGPLRHESAGSVTRLVAALMRGGTPPTDIMVLTPFRAQRTLLRQSLRHAGIAGVAVSTVHKAQGSERHTVLFDPVDGSSPFLQSEDARRLVNVAVSRAQARLVIFLSEVDRQNLLFANLTAAVGERKEPVAAGVPTAAGPAEPTRPATPPLRERAGDLKMILFSKDFPACALGRRLDVRGIIGEVVAFTETNFDLCDERGEIRCFSVVHLRRFYPR